MLLGFVSLVLRTPDWISKQLNCLDFRPSDVVSDCPNTAVIGKWNFVRPLGVIKDKKKINRSAKIAAKVLCGEVTRIHKTAHNLTSS